MCSSPISFHLAEAGAARFSWSPNPPCPQIPGPRLMVQAPQWDGLFHHSLHLPWSTFKIHLLNVMRQILLSGARVLLPVMPIWANAEFAVAGQPWPSHDSFGDRWRSTERAQTAKYSTFSSYTCQFSLLQKQQSAH